MKTGNPDDILDRIDSLPNWQVFLCCRTLVALLDKQLSAQSDSLRPSDLEVYDFDQFPPLGNSEIQRWCRSLGSTRRPALARLGRFLMAICLNHGYKQAVIGACGTAQAPVEHLGDLQPSQIMAALGVLISWMPDGQELPLPPANFFDRRKEVSNGIGQDPRPARPRKPVLN